MSARESQREKNLSVRARESVCVRVHACKCARVCVCVHVHVCMSVFVSAYGLLKNKNNKTNNAVFTFKLDSTRA